MPKVFIIIFHLDLVLITGSMQVKGKSSDRMRCEEKAWILYLAICQHDFRPGHDVSYGTPEH
jgi:hypothetical protein